MPTFAIGDTCVVKMGSSAAPSTPVDVSTYFKAIKIGEQIGNEDITTLGAADGAKVLAYLLNQMNFNADVLFDKPAGAFWARNGLIIRNRKIVTLEIYPSGEASGSEKLTCSVLVLNRDRTIGNSEADKGTLQFERSGPVTETTVP